MNIDTARNQANRYTRALTMREEGYRMEPATTDCYDIFKPGNDTGLADYTVDLYRNTCECEDSKKGNVCKHRYFVNIEIADEAAMWESICAEAERRKEEEGPDFPELPTKMPVYTVEAVLEALQKRIVADLEKAHKAADDRSTFDKRYWFNVEQCRRRDNLQGALTTINDYCTKEWASYLDLMGKQQINL